MERSRSSADSSVPTDKRRLSGGRRRVALLAASVAAAFVLLPVTASQADPEPSTEELQDKAERLHNKVEVLAERYNGLRVELKDAERAARRAKKHADNQAAKLGEAQGRIRQLAAVRYMTGGIDPAIELAVADNPQIVLDRAATLHRMSREDALRLRELQDTVAAAEAAQEAAGKRAEEVKKLEDELSDKKDKIESLLDETRAELLQRAGRGDTAGPLPTVTLPGSDKATKAANFALSQMGDPYVWGAAGPNAYDCSGLTMWAYQQVGISLPHYTGAQYAAGTPVSRSQLRVGDLVFFYPDRHHMGIYIGNGKMVHAPYTGTVVRIDPIAGRPWAGAVRVA